VRPAFSRGGSLLENRKKAHTNIDAPKSKA
jgi:hypothetical protein